MSNCTSLANSQWPDGTTRSNANAFSILYEPRRIPDSARTPKKRSPQPSKAKQSAISLETPQERALRIALRVNRNTHFDHPTQADKDRTASVAGRHAFHGSEK